MNETFVNPFEEVEKGALSCSLSAFHIYWENFIKVSKIFDCIREQDKLNLVKDNPYLFDREFSKNTTPERVQMNIDRKLSECYGACSSIYYVMQKPSGISLRIINN